MGSGRIFVMIAKTDKCFFSDLNKATALGITPNTRHANTSMRIMKAGPIGRIQDPRGTENMGYEILMANKTPTKPTVKPKIDTTLGHLVLSSLISNSRTTN